jgi:hypothetical protein
MAARLAVWLFLLTFLATALPVLADEDARTKQLRLLCAQISGDLTEPGGIAAFRRCLTRDPVDAMKQNAFPGAGAPTGPPIAAPAGFGENSRQSVAGAVVDFQVVTGKIVYALVTDQKLWRSTPGSTVGVVIDSAVAGFRAIDGGLVYVLGTNGRLWRETGDANPRAFVDAEVAAFQPIEGGLIYVRGLDGKLWRETGDMHNRQLVDRDVAAFQAIDARSVFVLGHDGKLWRETGDERTRSFIAGQIGRFHVIGDTVYVLTQPDHLLWRQTGSQAPERVAGEVRDFQPVDMNLVYVRDTAGRLWRELGNDSQRELVDRNLAPEAEPAGFQAVDAAQIYVLDKNHALWLEKMPPGR